jgi:Zn-dependent protease with chaperone function
MVRRLESFAREQPRAYRRNVLLLGLLGYVYIFGILALLAGGCVILLLLAARFRQAYAAFKLGMPLLALAYLILRSLWVRLEPPEGVEVDARKAPRLVAEIESIRQALGSPGVDRILLTGEFNAGVAQIPRLGILGWTRNYFAIGLPLLMALSPLQFRAVMLHEFGHLSGGHGKTGSFVCRIRVTWSRLMEIMAESEHWGAIFFRRFFAWYAPFFNSYSFVLARGQEYEADRMAATLTSAKNTAAALVAIEVRNRYLDRVFWPRVCGAVANDAEPPFPFTRMLTDPLRPDDGTAMEWLSRALRRSTGTADTHPALGDRLKALGCDPVVTEPLARSAAAYFLGESLPEMVDEIDARWRARVEGTWRERHEYLQGAMKRRAELLATAPAERTAENEREIAAIVELLEGGEAALPLYRAELDRTPLDASLQYAVGRILLESGNGVGIAHIERAMELDRSLEMDGCNLIYAHLTAEGCDAEARPYLRRWEESAEIHRLARRERHSVSVRDAVHPHRLEEGEVRRIAEQLQRYPELQAAWLAEKTVRYLPGNPFYILVVSISAPWYRYRAAGYFSGFARRLARELHCPGETLIMVAEQPGTRQLWKKIAQIPESRIFSRTSRSGGRRKG